LSRRLLVLYTADIHESLPVYPALASLIRHQRSQAARRGVPSLYLDNGDSSDAMVAASDVSRGAANFAMLAAAGCDAMTVGEGDAMRWGPQNITRIAPQVSFPILGANLRDRRGRTWPGLKEEVVFHRGGIKVGIFGLTVMFPTVYERFGCVQVKPLDLVPRIVQKLRRSGAEFIICVSHSGLAADIEMARAFQGIDMLVSAHSHDTPIFGQVRVGSTAVVHPGADGEFLGRADVESDGAGWRIEARLIPNHGDARPDRTVEREWRLWNQRAEQVLESPIGESAADFELRQDRPCAAGALVCRALSQHMRADASLLYPGHLRSGLPAGRLLKKHAWELAPGSASPGAIELTVAQLRQMVARAVAFRNRPSRAIQRAHVGYLQSDRLAWSQDGEELRLDGELLANGSRRLRIAATDLELGLARRFPLLDPEIADTADIEVTRVLREVVESFIQEHSPLRPPDGRGG
jgi:5'-nucleotidase